MSFLHLRHLTVPITRSSPHPFHRRPVGTGRWPDGTGDEVSNEWPKAWGVSRETKADHDHFHSPVTPAPWSLVHPSPSVPPSLRGPYGADRNERRMNEWRDGPRGPGWGRIKGPRTPSPSGLRVCRSLTTLPHSFREWGTSERHTTEEAQGAGKVWGIW